MTLPVGEIICGDCQDVLAKCSTSEIALVLTDPPYPDALTQEYGYRAGLLDVLKRFSCRQLIFWSAKCDFELDYTAIHVWDKRVGVASEYERIFERNGQRNYRLFSMSMINSRVTARYCHDVYTGHPSQKPALLLMKLIEYASKPNDLILDPFCGSGSTLVAAERLGRRWIGIDLDPHWCDVARRRTSQRGLFCTTEAK